MHQAEEQFSRWRCYGHAVGCSRAIDDDGSRVVDPVVCVGRVAVGLEQKARGRRGPGNYRAVARIGDGERGRTGCLHSVKRPEAASEGIISAGHCAAGILLAGGAAQGVVAPGARAASAGDFIPANGIGLRMDCRGKSPQ